MDVRQVEEAEERSMGSSDEESSWSNSFAQEVAASKVAHTADSNQVSGDASTRANGLIVVPVYVHADANGGGYCDEDTSEARECTCDSVSDVVGEAERQRHEVGGEAACKAADGEEADEADEDVIEVIEAREVTIVPSKRRLPRKSPSNRLWRASGRCKMVS